MSSLKVGVRWLSTAIGLSLLLLIQSALPSQAQPTLGPADYVPGEILVGFRPGVGLAERTLLYRSFGVGAEPSASSAAGDVVKLKVNQGEELQTVSALMRQRSVRFAEPNYVYHKIGVSNLMPNDPVFASHQWYLERIRVPSAWDVTTGDPSVRVAVIDSGFDVEHPDRPTNLLSGPDFVTGGNVLTDPDGHGTHVSGIIAAAINNGVGIAGVAPNTTLLVIRSLDEQGRGTGLDLARGVRWAADNGARIINLSQGGTAPSYTVKDAIDYAAGKGALVVAASGNCGETIPVPEESCNSTINPIIYPASFPNVLAVGATNDRDGRARYSEYGPYVALVAPGGDPTSNRDSDPTHWITSTVPGSLGRPPLGPYAQVAGTSQAAPQVAGVAGLVLSINPRLSPEELTAVLTDSARDLGPAGRDPEFGAGLVDALAAVRAAQQSLTPTPTPTAAVSLTPTATPLRPTSTPVSWRTRSTVYLPFAAQRFGAAVSTPTPAAGAPSPTPTRTSSPTPTPLAIDVQPVPSSHLVAGCWAATGVRPEVGDELFVIARLLTSARQSVPDTQFAVGVRYRSRGQTWYLGNRTGGTGQAALSFSVNEPLAVDAVTLAFNLDGRWIANDLPLTSANECREG
ncbi:MAG: S8 family serine peptidase [Chloroflexi bacterium]|nr:S8 family serine peptidase [Chloroflexota bacterium]